MRWTAVALVALTACASSRMGTAPVDVKVVAQPPIEMRDADLLNRITQEYVQHYAHNAQPMTLTITIAEGADILAAHDPMQPGSYATLAQTYPVSSGHAVPLVGGQTASEVGFMPTVGVASGSVGGPSGLPIGFDAGVFAVYTISDASGRVLEKRNIPLMQATQTAFPVLHLQQYHDAAVYIAKRVAALSGS